VTAASVFDVLTIGRCGVDFYPLQHGSLVYVDRYQKFLGGSPTNVAVAAARLGERSAVITRTGDDPFGAFVRHALTGYGVDDRYVQSVANLQTPVTFCETFPPDDFPIYFYRKPKAPDLEIYSDELDMDAIASARLFWVSLSGFSVEPSRSATMAAMAQRNRTGHTVIDLDYRASFWTSLEEAREQARRAVSVATIAVGNQTEVSVAVETNDPDTAADRLLELGVTLAVVKMGPEGVLAKTGTERVVASPVPVEVVNGLGAGDSFGGALCHGVLAQWPLERTLQFANAAGAIVASQLACSDAMPTIEEIELVLKGTHRA
jgi:5-dehydro-2-deoxygluconokinase